MRLFKAFLTYFYHSRTFQLSSIHSLCMGRFFPVEFSRSFCSVKNKSFSLAEEVIRPYLNSNHIPWTEIIFQITDSETQSNKSVSGCILRTCVVLNWVDVGLSYYKYLSGKGCDLSLVEYALLLKLLGKSPSDILKNEELVIKLFEHFKPHIEFQEVIQNDACFVFSLFKKTWKELLVISERVELEKVSELIAAAFHFDEPEIGWKMWYKNYKSFDSKSVKSYFNYCIKKAEENKFSINLLNDLVTFCEKQVIVLPNMNLLSDLKLLTSVLNNSAHSEYTWHVEETVISSENYCGNCGNKLNTSGLTKEEFKKLKAHILNDIIINENIYIKSTEKEAKKFFSFLKSCSHYDIVLDGLNIHFKNKKKIFMKVLNHFLNLKKKILLIGKYHLMKSNNYKAIKSQCQVFLTDNLSDDDVFLMYAALSGGFGTGFVTSDFLRGYSQYFKCEEIKKIFIKWQMTHQYFITPDGFILNPTIHSNLPQKTTLNSGLGDEKNHCWHFPFYHEAEIQFRNRKQFQWVCLIASSKPKKRV